MQEKLVKTALATFVKAGWSGKNESGWQPVGDRVIILPDEASQTTASGLVHIPEDMRERLTLAAEQGVLIAAGEGAFVWNSDRATPFVGKKPKPGDRINMHRFSGQLLKGADGKTYRIMDSQEIGAIEEGTE